MADSEQLPQLLLYKTFGRDSNTAELLPTHVRTPDGKEYELRSDELREEVSRQFYEDNRVRVVRVGAGARSEIGQERARD